MKDRIRQLMESQKLTQQKFADMINISPASLSSIFNDRTKPTLNHVEAIKKSFPDINLEWLLYGTGDMYKSQNAQNTAPQPQAAPDTLMFDFGESSPSPLQTHNEQHTEQTQQHTMQSPEKTVVKYVDKPQRKITEIRIFYDDQTWESFVSKK